MTERAADAYKILGDLMGRHGHEKEAQAFQKKSAKWKRWLLKANQSSSLTSPTDQEHTVHSAPQSTTVTLDVNPNPYQATTQQRYSTAILPQDIFPSHVRPFSIDFQPPEAGSYLNNTRQLACCLGLLEKAIELDDILDPSIRDWLRTTKNDPDEVERLKKLATDVMREFKRDEFRDARAVTEVLWLAHVLDKDDYRYLVKEFITGIEKSILLDVHQLEGLARLIQSAETGYLDTDDLVNILNILSTRSRDAHQQSASHLYLLTVALTRVLDAMVDASVSGLDREKIHEPLSAYLNELKGSSDSYLVYQVAYAHQALLHIPDNESPWQAAMRRTGKVMQGVFGLVSAVKALDLNKFIGSLDNIQQGLGASQVVQFVKTTYESANSLIESGQGFFDCLKEGLSFERKCVWYAALRGADMLIREGQFVEFKNLVCEAPCRRDVAFQWGVCQQLGEIAASSTWDPETRRCAISFLGEIYQNDTEWGHQVIVKQLIVDILMQMATLPGGETQCMFRR
ncbi:hypothetical protein BGX34_005255 [Mortierella sp. NVP85]|nr:hypothetical protein BGX34_005255 [Mortierella sp. NVP85]